MRSRSRTIAGTTSVVLLILLGTTDVAQAQSEFPSGGTRYSITPQKDTWMFHDSNGGGAVSVGYTSSPYKIYHQYYLSQQNRSICVENTLNETVEIRETLGNRRVLFDSHTGARCDYIHHPTYSGGGLKNYDMIVHDVFRVDIGGRTGTATLDAIARYAVTLV
jgi:hypothetical protein